MIGAGSWLLPACLEKLQEISGAAAFFVDTQTAAEQNPIRSWYLNVRFMFNMFEFNALVNKKINLLEQVVRKTLLRLQD